MQIHYLELVTDDVEGTCKASSITYGVTFGDADQRLGNARTAQMKNGGMIGVRPPMSDTEELVIRPYWLVENIEQSYKKVIEAGAEAAHPPLEIPGLGRFAIYQLGGNQQGLWQK